MSAISHHYEQGLEFAVPNPLKKLAKTLKGFFPGDDASKAARIYHGNFHYSLVPDTAISDFCNMKKITSLSSGDCLLYVFEKPRYQGRYWIVGRGETAGVEQCGSLIATTQPVALEAVQKSGIAPGHLWEMSGPKYLMHFYAAYRYA
ncbi:MAG: hypothetical protein K6T80_01435 [Firmicutes bacterium]|nr:hypothetical protein [Bacillota bacterium]